MTLRDGVRRLRADDPETGWLVRIAISGVMVWLTLTEGFHPATACWALFLLTDRRWPRIAQGALALAALLSATLSEPSSLFYLYAALFMFVLLPRTPMWAILTLTAAVLVVLLGGLWRAGHGTASMITQPALIATLVLFTLHRRVHRLHAEQIQQTRQARARAAALDERARIARELHDVLAHSLGALGVQLEVAEAQLTERNDVAGAADRIRRARRLAAEGLVEARSAVAALRADVPPLSRALADLAASYRADHGAAITLRVEGEVRPLSPGAEVALPRIAREALTNAMRHAPGAPVTLTLDFRPAAVVLTSLNPMGSDRSDSDSSTDTGTHGLIGARERVALLGGTLEAGRVDGDWRLVVAVPE
ncbi:sensor histidine kinase [Actinoplanes sp. G11-F43]|uniref:sensor histidine kinase n=1 Tax=Actinoplanes sp. G11-F43 TaxID=3424130 RepID=UPI003D33450E